VRIDGLRLFDPLPDVKSEKGFLAACRDVYMNGYVTGSDHPTTRPSHVHNRLSEGLWQYFSRTSRFRQAIEFWTPLAAREPELAVFVARAQRHLGELAAGVCTVARALLQRPHSWTLLCEEAEILLAQNKITKAVEVAKLAVEQSPGSTQCWLVYATCCVAAKEYEKALVCLNLAPMGNKSAPRVLTLTPIKRIHCDDTIPASAMAERAGAEAISKLPGKGLRPTFSDAYAVLASMLRAIGWRALLSKRSQVFVLQHEFRVAPDVSPDQPGEEQESLAAAEQEQQPQSKSEQPPAPSAGADAGASAASATAAESGEKAAGSASADGASDTPSKKMQRLARPAGFSSATDALSGGAGKGSGAGEAGAMGPKRLCEPWLEHLFQCMFHDVRMFITVSQVSRGMVTR
jgi:Chs5-Arf1p-binding protein BUD7/BCH1